MSLHIIILAAGQGKRMYSNVSKVLHPIAGKPMIEWVLDTANKLNPETIHVVYGHHGQELKDALQHYAVNWVEQTEQLGTGHAVLQVLPNIPIDAEVLVLYGDVPLISLDTLNDLLENSKHCSLSLLTAIFENPFGFGRIIRNNNNEIITIIEEKDASVEERQITEIYTGICVAKASDLNNWLPNLKNHNTQKEYYLTDIISIAVEENKQISSVTTPLLLEIQGVNNRVQQQQLERAWQEWNAEKLLLQGVTLADAKRLDIRGELICGKDVFIDVNCIFKGKVILGDNCRIGPNCILTDVTLGAHCEILEFSSLQGSQLDTFCQIGPFARLRPGTKLASHCKVGNFVEIKKSSFDEGSKASHLSYIGDAVVGKKVNIGAGTITCNYDGVNKYNTIIEDGVFIGSATQLVAPVTIGKNATIGAGSTIRKDAPAGELTLTEAKQKTVFGWKRPEVK